MYFIRSACCIFLVSFLLNFNSVCCLSPPQQPAEILSRELERLLEELTNLKSQLSQWFLQSNKNNNNNRTCNDQEYLGIISNYLHDNHTEVTTEHREANRKNKISAFLDGLKEKIYKIIHRKNSTEEPSSRHIRRCIAKSVKIHRNNSTTTKSANEVEKFQQYLDKVIKCLEAHRKKPIEGNFI